MVAAADEAGPVPAQQHVPDQHPAAARLLGPCSALALDVGQRRIGLPQSATRHTAVIEHRGHVLAEPKCPVEKRQRRGIVTGLQGAEPAQLQRIEIVAVYLQHLRVKRARLAKLALLLLREAGLQKRRDGGRRLSGHGAITG